MTDPGADPDRYVVHTADGRVHDETDAAGALRPARPDSPRLSKSNRRS